MARKEQQGSAVADSEKELLGLMHAVIDWDIRIVHVEAKHKQTVINDKVTSLGKILMIDKLWLMKLHMYSQRNT